MGEISKLRHYFEEMLLNLFKIVKENRCCVGKNRKSRIVKTDIIFSVLEINEKTLHKKHVRYFPLFGRQFRDHCLFVSLIVELRKNVSPEIQPLKNGCLATLVMRLSGMLDNGILSRDEYKLFVSFSMDDYIF